MTVKVERPRFDDTKERLAAERPRGTFSRQLVLGDNLDTDKITANYDAGVLALEIPVAESSKSRQIEVSDGGANNKRSHRNQLRLNEKEAP